MKLRINPIICEKIPGIQIGVVVVKNLQNHRKITTIEQLLRGVCAQKKREFKDETKMKVVENLIDKTRFDTQILPSTLLFESKVKKIKRGRTLEDKDNLYNLLNFISIKYMAPLFAWDLDEVDQDLEIDFKKQRKGKKADDFSLSRTTRNIVFWITDIGSHTKEEFQALPKEFAELIYKYCGGTEAEIQFLNCDTAEIDLDYVSQKEMAALHEKAQKSSLQEESPTEESPTEESPTEESPTEESPTEESPTEESPSELSQKKKAQPPFLNKKQDKSPTTAKVQLKGEPLLKEKLAKAITKVTKSWLKEEAEIETPNNPEHGDYSTNIALKLGKKLEKNPHEMAEEIIKALPTLDYIKKIEIADPGFINFHLSQSHLKGELDKILKLKENFGRLGIGMGKKVLVEYSSPNIAKPLGVHHLLSTIIGQTIADIHKYAGYDTITLNWPGDWGTQFGKLLYAYKTWGDEKTVKKDPLNELLKLYVKFHDEEEKDPEFVENGREEFKKLEEGDEENIKLWEWFKDISIKELERIYEKLGVHFDEYLGERMYLEDSKKIVEEGKTKGIITEGEKGALIVEFEDEKYPPLMLQKADGTTLYATRDLATLKDRCERYKPDKSLYVVDVSQKLHLQQVFETGRKFGWDKAEHIIFGRMQMPEGRMSTRKGDVILLDEVIKEAVKRTKKIIEEKNHNLSKEELNHIAGKMAIGAIKYNIISQSRETNITFEWDKMLSIDGNSAPYIQYANARAQSILRKAKEQETESAINNNNPQTSLFSIDNAKKAEEEKDTQPFGHQTEQTLLRLLPRFPETIELAVQECKPNIVTTYLFDLARAFNSFYNQVQVVNAARPELRESRLELVEAVSQVLQNGLNLLGIEVFERM